MHVNEAGADYSAVGFNDPARLCWVKLTDGSNALITNANISVVPRARRTIYDAAPLNNKVKHCQASLETRYDLDSIRTLHNAYLSYQDMRISLRHRIALVKPWGSGEPVQCLVVLDSSALLN
ncbi:hypothetical protein ES703_64778 [subsurface metagenome]